MSLKFNNSPVPRKVLLVDDDISVLKILSMHLSRAGFEVETAVNGVIGFERFLEDTWDLVITDLTMPNMNGEKLARAIRQEVPELPIVLITGLAGRSAPPGLFDAVLHKPFTRETLLACVNRVVKLPVS